MTTAMPTRPSPIPPPAAPVSIECLEYHGWPDAYRISNGKAYSVIVPAIGRIMQFATVGDESGVFWENKSVDGEAADPAIPRWMNFGGDKAWPAPQDDWEKVTGRAWPPPAAFDSLPMRPEVEDTTLVLHSEMDRYYGIEVVRRIVLDPVDAALTVTTEYHKRRGRPVRVGIWVVTQLPDPKRIFVLLPLRPCGAPVERMMGPVPRDLTIQGRLLSLSRDPKHNLKIGTRGSTLLWIGERSLLRIDSNQARAGARTGCSAQVYCNRDPLAYVELETAGPIVTLGAGERLQQVNTYRIFPRLMPDVAAEARIVLGMGETEPRTGGER